MHNQPRPNTATITLTLLTLLICIPVLPIYLLIGAVLGYRKEQQFIAFIARYPGMSLPDLKGVRLRAWTMYLLAWPMYFIDPKYRNAERKVRNGAAISDHGNFGSELGSELDWGQDDLDEPAYDLN